MAQSKRAWKLQEFVAHGENVCCAALGQNSGRVLVTGGEDKKVNLWTVDKPNCIMSLSGHTSAVEAVRFGQQEETIVSGTRSGALKVWNLEAAKMMRVLTGHKANIRCLDFHPCGEFIASGSMDTNVKLWDMKRKGCIFTYKGHTNSVNCLRFSPDGRWVASGDADGVIKIWDLQAGKLMKEMTGHSSAVNTLEFHPSECLLASGSADKTIRFWDVEKFELVSASEPDAGNVKCILFYPETEECLFSAAPEVVRSYGWEPTEVFDTIASGWGNVASLAISSSQLIGVTYSQSSISTYCVDLKRVLPIGSPSPDYGGKAEVPRHRSPTGRKSFAPGRPPTSCARKPDETPSSESGFREEKPTSAETDNRVSIGEKSSANEVTVNNPDEFKHLVSRFKRHSIEPSGGGDHSSQPNAPPDSRLPAHHQHPFPPAPAPFAPPAALDDPSWHPASKKDVQQLGQRPDALPGLPFPLSHLPPSVHQQQGLPFPSSIPDSAKSPAAPVGGGAFRPKTAAPTEHEALNSISTGHSAMTTVLANRHRNLQIIRALWSGGDVKTAVDSAVSMQDQAVLVDVLNILLLRSSLWNLSLSATLLPHLHQLLLSKYENYVVTSLQSVKLILKNFGQVIKSNLSAPPSPANGIDIQREERYDKCRQCWQMLTGISKTLDRNFPSLPGGAPTSLEPLVKEVLFLLQGVNN